MTRTNSAIWIMPRGMSKSCSATLRPHCRPVSTDLRRRTSTPTARGFGSQRSAVAAPRRGTHSLRATATMAKSSTSSTASRTTTPPRSICNPPIGFITHKKKRERPTKCRPFLRLFRSGRRICFGKFGEQRLYFRIVANHDESKKGTYDVQNFQNDFRLRQ